MNPTPTVSRRRWLKTGAASIATAVATRQSWAAPRPQPDLKILFYTDVHAGLDSSLTKPLTAAARAMRDVASDVVISGGDAIHAGHRSTVAQAAPRFQQYRTFLDQLDRPVEHAIGNHDLAGAAPDDGSPPAEDPRAHAVKELGIQAPYRTFEVGEHRFIILDSVALTGDEHVYRGHVDSRQLDWLRATLNDTPRTQPLVLVTHVPLRTTFLQEKSGPETPLTDRLVVANANEVLAAFEGRPLPLILQGHLHSNEVIDWAGRKHVMGGAISGAWWRGPHFQTTHGFGVITISDRRTDWEYRTYDWSPTSSA